MTKLLGRIVADMSADDPDAVILWLHCAQEDELFHVLGAEA
ncbi:hypothetical protein ACS7SF_13525 [Ralstonia sp. 25C]